MHDCTNAQIEQDSDTQKQPIAAAMLQDSDVSDFHSDDETSSTSSAFSSSPFSVASPSYSPCTVSSLSDKEEDAFTSAEVVADNNPVDGDKPVESENPPWCGYKVVTDNYDTNISPSYQRIDKQKQSLHVMHSCGVKDRVDMTSLSEERPKRVEYKPNDLLPSDNDITALKEEMIILLARQVKKCLYGNIFNVPPSPPLSWQCCM